MIRIRIIKSFLAISLLACLSSGSVWAQAQQIRYSQGNSVQMIMDLRWGGPLGTTGTVGAQRIQWPAGSGNQMGCDGWGLGTMVAQDLNGDGLPEDTIAQGQSGNTCEGYNASPWNRSVIEALAAGGEVNMRNRMSQIDVNRVWSSLEPGDLANWPIEGREGYTASGDPVLHGAETMFMHFSNVWETYAGPNCAVYYSWSCYFLNFGETNDMMFVHNVISNVSPYMKYNTNFPYQQIGLANPGGWKWHGMLQAFYLRYFSYGSNIIAGNSGWAYHPEKRISANYPSEATRSDFNPPEPPIMGWKILKYPQLRGQQAGVLNVHTASSDFGLANIPEAFAGTVIALQYRRMKGEVDLDPGKANPWTGRTGVYGVPGVLQPADARYNQWLWGSVSPRGITEYWGEITDVEPFDTLSLDWVLFFSEPGVKPLVRPTLDLANIDAPIMQQGLAPLENLAEIAQLVYEGGYIVPQTPVPPPLTIIPGDREVTLTWSDINIQTPDAYYYFLEANDLNPQGYYREFDFEGYRVYRSYVGPNDSHSELLADLNISGGTLKYHFVDRLVDDITYGRMRNGAKIWYAVVPYDRNYDAITGEMFSLPDPASGKVWNRQSQDLYQVIPRSEASNWRPAEQVGGVTYTPAFGSPQPYGPLTSILTGDGAGLFDEPPRFLQPQIELTFTPVIFERIDKALDLQLVCTGDFGLYTLDARPLTHRNFELRDGSTVIDQVTINYRRWNGPNEEAVVFNGPRDQQGLDWVLDANFKYTVGQAYLDLYYYMDLGGYQPGMTKVFIDSWLTNGYNPAAGRFTDRFYGAYAPVNPPRIRSGRFTVTWKDAGNGQLTVDVMDLARGEAVPFSNIMDNWGWGFVTEEIRGQPWSVANEADGFAGIRPYMDMWNKVPVEQRTALMVQSLPANNTQPYAIWLDGFLWVIRGDAADKLVTGMPAPGTTFTADVAYGAWNGPRTEFTQWPDPPYPGDTWSIKVNPSTLNPEDADLSKIKVVPNPYMASSFLDFSPNERRIEFINLPARCTIRIYSLGGNLVNVLNHIGVNRQGWGNYTDWDRMTQGVPEQYTGFDNHGGTEPWNLRNRYGQTVASGLYFYHVTDERGKTHTGKFYVVN